MARYVLVTVALLFSFLAHQLGAGQAKQPEPSLLADLQRHASPIAPRGRGPFPVAVLVPGCSGFDETRFAERYRAHTERLLAAGFAVVRVDYLKARSVREACAARDAAIWEPQIAADVGRLVQRLPEALQPDRSRIFVIGWSMGGGGVLTALSTLGQSNPFPFRRAVALYPSCRAARPWNVRLPTLIVLAGLDNIQPTVACDELIKSVGSLTAITVRRFERAHHGFDIIAQPVILEPRDTPTVAANPEAAAEAWDEIVKFLTGA
jgi:dienelactone hydrolase